MSRLSNEERANLLARYGRGESSTDLAKVFGVTVQTVYNVLKRDGAVLRAGGVSEKQRATILRACSRGVPIAGVARHLGISISTAKRVVRAHRESGEALPIKKGRPKNWKAIINDRVPDEELVDKICRSLQREAFPFPQPLSDDDFATELQRLRNTITRLEDGAVVPRNTVGVRMCHAFFLHRYRATWKTHVSAFDAWRDEKLMKEAIRLQIRYGDPVTPPRILRALTLLCRTPTIFRPAVARFVYERYCSTGDTVWDPCSGFGGRLLGAHVARVRYIGTDADEETAESNNRLAQRLEARATVTAVCAEDFEPPRVKLVFTSPPYFDRERYSSGRNQSWRRHGATLDTWLAGFLRPVVERARRALVDGGHLVLNVADLRHKNAVTPIVQRTIETALSVGFAHVETLQMPLAAVNRKKPTEPILVFQK